MGKGQKKYKLFCITILTILLTACGQTEMKVHTAEEITYTYTVSDGWGTAAYLALIPNFPEAKEDKVLQKIQQYCEEDLILTEEQKAAYEEYAGQEGFVGGQTEDT